MPRQKPKLGETEARRYRNILSALENMGVAVGSQGDFLQPPPSKLAESLWLEPVDYQSPTIFDLPGVNFAVVILARLLVRSRQCWIAGSEIVVPWGCPELEFSGCEETPYYDRLISGCIPFPPILLNPFLTGEQPLRSGLVTGVIIAISYSAVPDRYLDHQLVPLELSLYDEWKNELRFSITANVDRSLKVAYERQGRTNRPKHPRESLFESIDDLLWNRNELPSGSAGDAGELSTERGKGLNNRGRERQSTEP